MNKIINGIKRHLVLLFVVVLSLVGVVILVLLLIPKNSSSLVISVAPVDASITINNKSYSNGVFSNMAPGHYTAMISKDGFETKYVGFDLKNDEITTLSEYLVQSDQKMDYYESDAESLFVLREYASLHEDETAKTFLEEYDKKRSVKNFLPIEYAVAGTGDYYRIIFRENDSACEKNYCIEIGANNAYYNEAAITVLKDHGYNIDDYQIVYTFDGCD